MEALKTSEHQQHAPVPRRAALTVLGQQMKEELGRAFPQCQFSSSCEGFMDIFCISARHQLYIELSVWNTDCFLVYMNRNGGDKHLFEGNIRAIIAYLKRFFEINKCSPGI